MTTQSFPARALVGLMATVALAAFTPAPALAAEPMATLALPLPAGFSLSEDGAFVIDARGKLAWSRCVEGMYWNGKTCAGQPSALTLAQATALAASRRKADGTGWRLPRVAELRRLVNKSARPPGLNPRLFPAAPGDWHWSATANIGQPAVNPYNYSNISQGRTAENAGQKAVLEGWAVNLDNGEARGDITRNTPLPVRLVLPLD